MNARIYSTGLPHVKEMSGKNEIFSRSGKCQGILKKSVREFWSFDPCQGIVREFCDVMSGNFVMTLFIHSII